MKRRGILGVIAAALFTASLPTAAAAEPAPLDQFGTGGSAGGLFFNPRGIAVDGAGRVYVADLNNRISVFDPDGGFVRAFGWDVVEGNAETEFESCEAGMMCQGGASGEEEGQLSFASAIALGPDGNLFVSDSGNNRISVFDPGPPSSFVRAFGWDTIPGNLEPEFEVCSGSCKSGTFGGGPGQLASPQGVAFGPAGELYVADTFNDRVSVFGPGPPPSFARAFGWDVVAGNMETEFETCAATCIAADGGGGAGQLEGGRGLAFGPDGKLYVADRQNHRISGFNPGATPSFALAFGWDTIPGNLEPGFEVCSAICKAGTSGGGAGQLEFPAGPAIDAAGRLYVGEFQNRISGFDVGPPASFVHAFGADVIPANMETGFELCTAMTTCKEGDIAGTGPGAVANPDALAVDCRGAVWVADTVNDRIQRIGEPGTPLPPCPSLPATPTFPSPASAVAGPTSTASTPTRRCKKKKKRKRGAARKKCKKKRKRGPR